MNPSSAPSLLPWRRLLNYIVLPIAVVALAATATWTIHVRQTTGRLIVSTKLENASISISQNNKGAQTIGIGSADARLQPGRYEVAASSAGHGARAYVLIKAKQTTVLHLTEDEIAPLPSAASITFVGMESLIDNGLTSAQTTALRNMFFKYNKDAKVVAVDSTSIANGPRKSDSDPFTLNFTGTIDNLPYRATVTYSGLTDAQLTIYNPQTGAQLFNQSNAPPVQTAGPNEAGE